MNSKVFIDPTFICASRPLDSILRLQRARFCWIFTPDGIFKMPTGTLSGGNRARWSHFALSDGRGENMHLVLQMKNLICEIRKWTRASILSLEIRNKSRFKNFCILRFLGSTPAKQEVIGIFQLPDIASAPMSDRLS